MIKFLICSLCICGRSLFQVVNMKQQQMWICPAFANSVDPDQLALILICTVWHLVCELDQQSGSSNLIG